MELSSDVLRPFLVWGLLSGDETVVGNRRLHLLESSGTAIACFSFCRLVFVYVHRHGTHDQMMCLIFQFIADQLPIFVTLYAWSSAIIFQKLLLNNDIGSRRRQFLSDERKQWNTGKIMLLRKPVGETAIISLPRGKLLTFYGCSLLVFGS